MSEVVVDYAKREVQGDLHINPLLARAASAVVKRPCADLQLGPIFTGHVFANGSLVGAQPRSQLGPSTNWTCLCRPTLARACAASPPGSWDGARRLAWRV